MTQPKNIGNKKKSNNDKEDVIYGIHSVQMLFKKRPRDIKKVYLVESLKNKFSNLLRECAKRKIAYKLVEASALRIYQIVSITKVSVSIPDLKNNIAARIHQKTRER